MAWKGWENFTGVPGAEAAPAAKRAPRVKNAQPTEVDGHLFPSKHEAERYQELRYRERAGEIGELRLQFRFPLEVNGVLICHWVADFTYTEGGQLVVEDAKGMRTEVYRLKRKMFEAQYQLVIREV
jgi:hypothetical protein